MTRSKTFFLQFAAVILIGLLLTSVTKAQAPTPLQWKAQQLSDGQEDADYPGIVVDSYGRIHVVWSQNDTEAKRSIFYYALKEDGKPWAISDFMVASGGHKSLAIDEHDTLHLAWADGGSIRYSRASASEASSIKGWRAPTDVVETGEIVASPYILPDSRGVLHLAFSSLNVRSSAIYYTRSVDGGVTWSEPVIFDAPRANVATERPYLALGSNGVLHMVWGTTNTTSYYGGMGVYYARSTDGGVNWTKPLRLDDPSPDAPGNQAWQPSISVLSNQEVHVVWDAHIFSGRRYHTLSRDDGYTWTTPEPVGGLVSQTGPNPMFQDSSGALFLLLAGTFDWSKKQGVYISRWTGDKWGELQLVNLESSEPHWLHVALANGNRVHVVWSARSGQPPAIWYATTETSAPYVPSRPVPVESTPLATAAPTPTATPAVVALASRSSQAGSFPKDEPPNGLALVSVSHTMIALSVLPVLALLAGIVIAQRVFHGFR